MEGNLIQGRMVSFEKIMRINPIQAVLASVAILSTAVLAEAIRPRELLASIQVAPDLDCSFGPAYTGPVLGVRVEPSRPGGHAKAELT